MHLMCIIIAAAVTKDASVLLAMSPYLLCLHIPDVPSQIACADTQWLVSTGPLTFVSITMLIYVISPQKFPGT